MSSGFRLLKEAISARRFEPAYLLVGDEALLIDNLLRAVTNAAVEAGMQAFDVDVLSAAGSAPARIATALQLAPVAERRVVIVRDADSLKGKGLELLRRYLERPADRTILLLVAPSTSGPQLKESLGTRIVPVELEALSPLQTTRWIERYAKELGSALAPGAAVALQRRAGSNLSELASELAKLAAYADGDPIDEAAVEAVTGVREHHNIGALLDAIAERDSKAAGAMLAGVMANGRMSGVAIVMAVSAQTLGIATARALLEEKTPVPQVTAALKEMLRGSRGVITGRSWGDAVASWARAATTWEQEQIARAFHALDVADVALKDSRVSAEDSVVQGLILSLCSYG